MAKASGYSLYKQDARIVLRMEARGDRNHDIAAWFGVNQGRIAEVKNGDFGNLEAAPEADLPPSGAPGIKGRRVRAALDNAIAILDSGVDGAAEKATEILKAAAAKFDTNEG